jgi:hypothetical protein
VDINILPCPQCGIFLTRGDGCDSITCVCKYTFSWIRELRDFENSVLFSEAFPVDTSKACVEVLCLTIPGNPVYAEAYRKSHRIETNSALINWAKTQFGAYVTEWCATYSELSAVDSTKPAMLLEIQSLYKMLNSAAVENCIRLNDIAYQSIFSTFFRTDEDRARATIQLLRGVYGRRTSQLMYSYIPNVSERCREWESLHEGLISRAKQEHELLLMDQFLILYGAMTPLISLRSVSTATLVSRWDSLKSNQRLSFLDDDTVVKRQGNISCYPAAFATLSSNHSMCRFRLLDCELKGNSMSFGLTTDQFKKEGSSGVGASSNSWGLIDCRDVYAGPAYIFSSGVRVQAWRKLKQGDLITVEVDLEKVQLPSRDYLLFKYDFLELIN